MLIKATGFSASLSGKHSLHTVLIVAFVSQIIAAMGLTAWLLFYNGQRAVAELATQLRNESTARIQQHLKNHMAVPWLVNQLNVEAIRLGLLNFTDQAYLEGYLWNQIKQFDTLSYIAIATEQPIYIGTHTPTANIIYSEILNETTQGHLEIWNTNAQGQRTKRQRILKNYDPRNRPWYQAVVKAGKPIWSEVFVYFSGAGIGISANYPIYNQQDRLIAVASADITLTKISKFLHSLNIGQHGQTFIMTRLGGLIATSTTEEPYTINPATGQAAPIKAIASRNALTSATVNHLMQQFGDLKYIDHNQQLSFHYQDELQFLQVVPFQDPWGLDWLIVVVVPETDFMETIHTDSQVVLLLFILALVLATLIGIFTARWIVQPIQWLDIAAQQLASGKWDQTLPTERRDEIGNLAKSFSKMVEQLKYSFTELETKNTQLRKTENNLTKWLETLPVGILVLDAQAQPYYLNQVAKQILGKGIFKGAKSEDLPEIYHTYVVGTEQLYPLERQPLRRAIQGESSTVDDAEIHRVDKRIPVEVWGSPIFDDNGQLDYAIIAFQDITERKQAETTRRRFTEKLAQLNKQLEEYSHTLEQKVLERTVALEQANQELQKLARLDGLTQIANRRSFDETLNLQWRILRREQFPLSLILCDIDYFKYYNDSYGHQAGDECLRQVALAMNRASKRPADLVARYGGEEFAVIMPNTHPDGAWHVAVEIQREIRQLQMPHCRSPFHYITLSIGISSVIPHQTCCPKTLINSADEALYEAKKHGRNRIIIKTL
jgi:diguanylate cyclase (GGDEF)-like protein/PAS domain S-box-containing protein